MVYGKFSSSSRVCYREGHIVNSSRIIIITLLVLLFSVAISEAGWLSYHEAALSGVVLDYDSKSPLEGTVVVAEYNKAAMGLGAGSVSSTIAVRETLTDKNGHFHFPSYTTLIHPFSWQIPTILIIFSPGYASVKVDGKYFIGQDVTEEQDRPLPWTKILKYRLHGRGIVELPRIRTNAERKERMLGFPTGFGPEELPLLYKAYAEEKLLFKKHN